MKHLNGNNGCSLEGLTFPSFTRLTWWLWPFGPNTRAFIGSSYSIALLPIVGMMGTPPPPRLNWCLNASDLWLPLNLPSTVRPGLLPPPISPVKCCCLYRNGPMIGPWSHRRHAQRCWDWRHFWPWSNEFSTTLSTPAALWKDDMYSSSHCPSSNGIINKVSRFRWNGWRQ